MKSFIIKLIQRSRRQPEQGQGIVEYIMILAFVALAVFLIINLMGPAISNTFSDFVERAPVAPPELVGYTRVPPTATATNDPNPILTITYVGSCTGTVTQAPLPPYTGGAVVTLTAVPDAGCEFAGWGDALSGTNNPESIILTSDKTVSANFIPIKYTLNVAVYGNGAVTASPNKTEYDPNEVVTLTAAPESGYSFLLWQGDGTTGANPLVRTLTMDNDKSVDAYFQVGCYVVTLTADPPSGGSVNPSPSANCIGDPGKYEHGTAVDFTAVAAPGYVFSSWSGDITGSTNPYTGLSVIGPRNITANFVEQDYTLTMNVNPAGGGTLVTNPNLPTYHYGDQTQLTATASTGYTFSGWSGSASGSTNPYTLTFDENETVTANFTADCYTLTLGKLPANGGNVSTNPNSSGGCPSGQYIYGTTVTLTASPANGYRFQTWSGDISGTNATAGITMFGNMNITANFQQCYALNITISPSSGGTVSRNPAPGCTGGATYAPGTNVTLTAAANSGYTFNSWTGVDSSTGNTAIVNMNAARNVTANFTAQASCANPSLPLFTQINFQPASAPLPSGYLMDDGSAFGDRGNGFSYGWNANNTANARDRNDGSSPDQLHDTLNHMLFNGTFTWEIAVPNGDYEVCISAGDPSYVDSVNRINAEGVLVIDHTPTTSQKWGEGFEVVTVSDGRLSLTSAAGSVRNKINFIRLYSNEVMPISENFESGDWSGGIGWSGAWSHANESDITNSGSPHVGSYHLRLADNGTANRGADLSGLAGSGATLSFYWKATTPLASNEAWYVEVSSNGGSSWNQAFVINSSNVNSTYTQFTLSLNSSYLGSNFRIRFSGINQNDADDYFYVDDITITGS